jgi:hypothetical protein
MSSASSKSRFELIIELVRATVWPLIVIISLISFWEPLHKTAQQLPAIVGQSQTITIAGLSLKLQKGIENKPSLKVKEALSNISADSIKKLMTSNEASYWESNYTNSAKVENYELINLRLLEEIPYDQLNESTINRKKYGYGIRLTPLGKETQNFLLSLISEFVQELKTSETSKSS